MVIAAKTLEDPDGREFAVVTFTDITEQKRAETELRDANTLLEARAREIEEELTLASRVQQSLAPKSLVWGTASVETFYQPVRSIGGDFGLVTPSEDQLDLLVCDVSGHGISSALVANRIYTETMSQIERGEGLLCHDAPFESLRNPKSGQLGFLFHHGRGALEPRWPLARICRRGTSAGDVG